MARIIVIDEHAPVRERVGRLPQEARVASTWRRLRAVRAGKRFRHGLSSA
jgi:hypothetical protein